MLRAVATGMRPSSAPMRGSLHSHAQVGDGQRTRTWRETAHATGMRPPSRVEPGTRRGPARTRSPSAGGPRPTPHQRGRPAAAGDTHSGKSSSRPLPAPCQWFARLGSDSDGQDRLGLCAGCASVPGGLHRRTSSLHIRRALPRPSVLPAEPPTSPRVESRSCAPAGGRCSGRPSMVGSGPPASRKRPLLWSR